jgi:hypothetical protein
MTEGAGGGAEAAAVDGAMEGGEHARGAAGGNKAVQHGCDAMLQIPGSKALTRVSADGHGAVAGDGLEFWSSPIMKMAGRGM